MMLSGTEPVSNAFLKSSDINIYEKPCFQDSASLFLPLIRIL
jgi:hypothetical protein